MSYLETNNTILDESDRIKQKLNANDIYIAEDFDEASQFRYTHNDQIVEVGTPLGFDGKEAHGRVQFILFDGIYYQPEE